MYINDTGYMNDSVKCFYSTIEIKSNNHALFIYQTRWGFEYHANWIYLKDVELHIFEYKSRKKIKMNNEMFNF